MGAKILPRLVRRLLALTLQAFGGMTVSYRSNCLTGKHDDHSCLTLNDAGVPRTDQSSCPTALLPSCHPWA